MFPNERHFMLVCLCVQVFMLVQVFFFLCVCFVVNICEVLCISMFFFCNISNNIEIYKNIDIKGTNLLCLLLDSFLKNCVFIVCRLNDVYLCFMIELSFCNLRSLLRSWLLVHDLIVEYVVSVLFIGCIILLYYYEMLFIDKQ